MPTPEVDPKPQTKREAAALGLKLGRVRPWIQAGFLAVWLAPVGRWLHAIPGCVFHCYSCPLSAFACPVGVAANYAALIPVTFEIPWLLMGILLLAGVTVGSLICGWACPVGFFQDLLGRITRFKFPIPAWLGYGRYAVLIGLVLALPAALGAHGIPFEDQVISICRLCPAGALEAGLPYSASSFMRGEGWLMSWFKTAILIAFLVSAIVIYRPWCRIFCPLGGWLALFNRFSLFHLRFNSTACVECNLCRSRCPVGVKVDQRVNVSNCIRCLECTKCGAITPAIARPSNETQTLAPTSSGSVPPAAK